MDMTPAQCRAARALVDITQDRLAELSGVSKRTIAHFEAGQRSPIPANLAALQKALEGTGVEFTNGGEPGVKLRRQS
jgi:transcriptional regulator with XRE-family HTH domain